MVVAFIGGEKGARKGGPSRLYRMSALDSLWSRQRLCWLTFLEIIASGAGSGSAGYFVSRATYIGIPLQEHSEILTILSSKLWFKIIIDYISFRHMLNQ